MAKAPTWVGSEEGISQVEPSAHKYGEATLNPWPGDSGEIALTTTKGLLFKGQSLQILNNN
jgi:hypothetical protein